MALLLKDMMEMGFNLWAIIEVRLPTIWWRGVLLAETTSGFMELKAIDNV
jgi:hypothetical protein